MRTHNHLRVALVHGPDHEKADPRVIFTERRIARSLEARAWEVDLLFADQGTTLIKYLAKRQPDVLICYDYYTGDGLPLHLLAEEAGTPTLHSPQHVLDLLRDKELTKVSAREAGIETPSSVTIWPEDIATLPSFSGPYFIKPLRGSDSRAIGRDAVFTDPTKATLAARQRAIRDGEPYLVEQFLSVGKSMECAVFAASTSEGWISCAMEYRYRVPSEQNWPYLSRIVKDEPRIHRLRIVLRLDSEMRSLVEGTVRWLSIIGARGAVRAEFIRSGGKDWLIEANGIPGFNRCFKALAQAHDMSEGELLHRMLLATKNSHYPQEPKNHG